MNAVLQFARRFWLFVLAWTNGRNQRGSTPISADQRASAPSAADQRELAREVSEPEPDPQIVPVIVKPAPWRKVGKVKFNRPPRPKPKPREKNEEQKQEEEKKPAVMIVQRPFSDPVETGLINMGGEGIQEAYGRFYFRDTILDQLDSYFAYLRRVKKADPESFSLFSKVGAQIAPYGLRIFDHPSDPVLPKKMLELDVWWRRNKPGFGAVVYGADPLGEKFEREGDEELAKKGLTTWSSYIPKFLYFSKYSRPPAEFQPAPGADVYKMTIYWDKPNDPKFNKHNKGGVGQEYAVSIDKNGAIRVLLMLCDEPIRYRGRFLFQRRRWKIPEDYTEWAKTKGMTATSLLHEIFVDAVHRWEQAQSGAIRISARKSNMEAAFSIDAERVPYFFQDRDITINNNGKRAKIFHMVRAHMRQTAKGLVPVKISMRGERHFTWNGYDILITMPGKHHEPIIEFDVGSADEHQLEMDEPYFTMGQIGTIWAEHIHGRPFQEAMDEIKEKRNKEEKRGYAERSGASVATHGH